MKKILEKVQNMQWDSSWVFRTLFFILSILWMECVVKVWCLGTLWDRGFWYMLLFTSVLVVNVGYYALSVSDSLNSALMANRVAYLGSVFLPLSMLRTIQRISTHPIQSILRN